MASAKDDNLLTPYRTFLLDLSSKLLTDDLEKLKFACKDAVPYGKTEEVTIGFKFFDLLEQNGKISSQNLTPLENMVKAIGRADLALEVNQFMIGNDVPDGAQQDAGLQDDNPSNGPAVRQDEGDEVVPDGVADDLIEKKADKTVYVATDQPLEEKVETRVEASHVSCGLLQSDPPALNDPPSAQRTTPMAHRDNIVSTTSGRRGISAPVAQQSSTKPRLSNPEGQGIVQYVNFLVLEGYSVQIVGGKHFSTPDGEFVKLRSGTQYKILLKNSHPYACNVNISVDGYDVGGWIMHGGQQFTIERSAYEAKKFTFYRVKKAPKDAAIDPSRTEENGVVKCVFSPEAFVDIPVTVSESPQPLMVRFAPSATVGDLKEEIQKQLNKSPDRNQILALNNKELENHMRVSRVIESPGSLILVDVELDVTVEVSTSERCQIKIRPGEAKIIDLMQKIEAELEVPIKDQKLFYGKTRLSDNPHKGLPEKLIYSLNRTLVVIVPDYIEITVENSASGESTTLKIDKEKRLTDLVQEIPSCRNMDNNQEVMFLVDGRELSPVKDTGKLKSIGICPGSRVKLEVRVLFIKVFVAGLPQGRLTVQCNSLETFQDLLNHVQSRTKMAKIDDATFSAKGRVFDPKKDLNTLQGNYFVFSP
ncbi:Astrocytic phosphoprotein PEA-15 [Acropora cervicornis]|uniref:Astrocytic phosphoprotein PEA-15 n=1 Tax=Acropora cervicornis TaxID=6130 RepID=A0AAD9V0S5_ACRCE|nr:Astrocytic phosphoprotein PEA-15 [Acropora cervicornis]